MTTDTLSQCRQEHQHIFEQFLRLRMARLTLPYQDFQTRLEENIAGDLGLSSAVGTHEEAVVRAENRRATSHREQLGDALQIMNIWQVSDTDKLQLGLLDDQELSMEEIEQSIGRVYDSLLEHAHQRIDSLPFRDETKVALKQIYEDNLDRSGGHVTAYTQTQSLIQAARAHRQQNLSDREQAQLEEQLARNNLSLRMLMRAQTPAHMLEYAFLQTALTARTENAQEIRTVVQDYMRRGTLMNAFSLRPDSDRIQYLYTKGEGEFLGPQAYTARRLWRAVENNLVTLADSSGQKLMESVYTSFVQKTDQARHLPDGMHELLSNDLLRSHMVTQALKPVAAWLGLPKDSADWDSYRPDVKNSQMRDILQKSGLYNEGDTLPEWPSAVGVHKMLQASFCQQITQLPSLRDAPQKGEYGYDEYREAVKNLAGHFAAALTLQETSPEVSLDEMRERPMSTAPTKHGDDTLFTQRFVGIKNGELFVEAAEEYDEKRILELLEQQDANMRQNFASQMDETVQLWRKSGRDYTDSKLYKLCTEAGFEITSGEQIISLATGKESLQDAPIPLALSIRDEARRMIVDHLESVEKAEESQLAIPFGCTALDTAWQHVAQIPTTYVRRALEMQKLALDTSAETPELRNVPVVTEQEKKLLLATCDAWDKGKIQAADYCRVMFNFLVDNESNNRKDINTIIQDSRGKGFITEEQSKALDQQLSRADMQVGAHSLASALGFVVNDMHGVFHAQQQGAPHHTAALTVLSCASLINTTQAIRTLTHSSAQTGGATPVEAPISQANAAMAGTTYTHGIKGKGMGSGTLGVAMMSDKSANMFIRERLDTVSQKSRKYLSNAAMHESAHIIDYSLGAAMAKYLNDTALDKEQSASVRMAAASIVHLMPSAAQRTLPGSSSHNFIASAEKGLDTLAQAEVNSTTRVVSGSGDEKVERQVPNGAIMSGFAALPPDAWAVVSILRQKLPQTEQSTKLWDAAESMRRMFYREETAFSEGAIDYLKAFKQENIKDSGTFKQDLQKIYETALRPKLETAGLSRQDAQEAAAQIATNAAAQFANIPAKWSDGRTMASKLLSATSESEPNIWEAAKVFRVALVAILTKDTEHSSAKDRLNLLQKTTPQDVWRHVNTAMAGLTGIFELNASDKKVFGGLQVGEDTPKNGTTLRGLLSKNKPENAPTGHIKSTLQEVVDTIQKASIDAFRQTFLRNERLMEPQVKPTTYLAKELQSPKRNYYANASELFARAVEHVTTEKYLSGHIGPNIINLLKEHRDMLAEPNAETGGKRPSSKHTPQTYGATVGHANTACTDAASRVAKAIIDMAPQGWDVNPYVQGMAHARVQQALVSIMGGPHSEDYSQRTSTHATPQKKATQANVDEAQWAQERQDARNDLCQKIDTAIEVVQAYQEKCKQNDVASIDRADIGVALHVLVSQLDNNHTPLPLPANMLPHFTHSAHYPTAEMAAEAQLDKCVTAAFESANSIGGQALDQMLERNRENVLAENLQNDSGDLSAAQHVRTARSSAALADLLEHSSEENVKQVIYACFEKHQLSEDYLSVVTKNVPQQIQHVQPEPAYEEPSFSEEQPEPEPVDWAKARQLDFDF
ncbi:MAG: hypothetical protein IKZ87_08775 [Actinomycetaceae bacterium]|nr:hypothetical protein [Actinomycetaceae bacterium]